MTSASPSSQQSSNKEQELMRRRSITMHLFSNMRTPLLLLPIHIVGVSQFAYYTVLIWSAFFAAKYATPLSAFITGTPSFFWSNLVQDANGLFFDCICLIVFVVALSKRFASMLQPNRAFQCILLMSLAHLLLIAFQLAKDITHTPQLFQRFLKSSTSFTNQLSDSWSRTLETSSTSSVISNIQQGLSCCGFTSPLDRSVGSCGGGVSQEGHGQMIGMTGCKSVVEQSLFQTWLLMRFIIVGLRFFQVATYFGYYQLALEQIHASGEQHRDIDGVIYVSIFSTEVENESKFSLWFLPLIHLAHLRIHATHKYPVYMQESLGSYNNNDGMDEEPLPLYQKEGVNCRSPPEYLETIDIITSSPPSYTS